MAVEHVDLVRPVSVLAALDEPGIERRAIIPEGRPPKVVIPLSLEDRSYPSLGLLEAGDLDRNVHDGLGRKSGNGGAAKMLDPLDQIGR
jgi:hypothetical protein